MIRITGLPLPFDHNEDDLVLAVGDRLRLNKAEVLDISVEKRSLDARKKNSIKYIYTLDVRVLNEKAVINKFRDDRRISRKPDLKYTAPLSRKVKAKLRPVIIGTGPAGLFAGLILAEAGMEPILIERGEPVKTRVKVVSEFWKRGTLKSESNVQFGEGGAGTFSDGKLQTRVKDRENRNRKVLEELVKAGAPEDILIDHKPHIGTANLVRVVENLRAKILSMGGEYHFQTRMDDLIIEDGRLVGILLSRGKTISCDHLILAIGHSSRETYSMLQRRGIALEAKPFSIGLRIEHPQEMIDQSQFGSHAGHPQLGSASYQLAHHGRSGRTVYSFCMCPGGRVIAASSEPEIVVTNGMSQYARDEKNANSAIVAEVYPSDFGTEPLSGIEFQKVWEKIAYQIGGENYFAPCQLLGDFLDGIPSKGLGDVVPSYTPGFELTELNQALPDYVAVAIREALPQFEKRIKGFTRKDAVLTGVETRTSAPVRILRGKDFQSASTKGLYPAGEGSGYAGGILSSAMDGIKVAEAIIRSISGH